MCGQDPRHHDDRSSSSDRTPSPNYNHDYTPPTPLIVTLA